MDTWFGRSLKIYNVSGTSVVADYICRCLFIRTRSASVFIAGRISCRGVVYVSSEGRGEVSRDVDEVVR